MENLTPKKYTDNLFKDLGQGKAIYELQKAVYDLSFFTTGVGKKTALVYTSLSNANQIVFYSKCLVYANKIMIK